VAGALADGHPIGGQARLPRALRRLGDDVQRLGAQLGDDVRHHDAAAGRGLQQCSRVAELDAAVGQILQHGGHQVGQLRWKVDRYLDPGGRPRGRSSARSSGVVAWGIGKPGRIPV